MSASSLLRTSFILSSVLVSVAVTGCASDAEDQGDTTSSELRGGIPGGPFGDHGDGHGNGNGHGGFGGGGDGHGGHGHGFPHQGGHGAGQHIPGGHFGHPGPEQITAPQGVFFASINANGSGCPAGTWDVGISPDGQTFTLAFSAYEAVVDKGQAVDMKECLLDIALNSPDGLSYSVASFYYQGYVLLDTPGMTAQQTANYFFEHERDNDASKNLVSGPVDQSYLFTDEIGPERRMWSPCGHADTLHVRTRLSLNNTPDAAGSGYLNNSTVDGSLSFKWNLNWRRCHGPG
jgi:hypothetical protein